MAQTRTHGGTPPVNPPGKKRSNEKGDAVDEKAITVNVFDVRGARSGELELPRAVFGSVPNMAVMHQAYLRQLANVRQGSANTKTRSEVSGGGPKPYRQKGTGRARHGSTREPQMAGGGTVFGPHPRSFRQKMPRRMRRLALRSALSVKASEGKVAVLEGFELEEPSTRGVLDVLQEIGVEDTALLVLPAANLVVQRSLNNLPWAKVILWSNLNLYDLFTHDRLIVHRDALEPLVETFGDPAASAADGVVAVQRPAPAPAGESSPAPRRRTSARSTAEKAEPETEEKAERKAGPEAQQKSEPGGQVSEQEGGQAGEQEGGEQPGRRRSSRSEQRSDEE
jgi:large subunit ribosomal protein L4